jgi:hypothetical protein
VEKKQSPQWGYVVIKEYDAVVGRHQCSVMREHSKFQAASSRRPSFHVSKHTHSCCSHWPRLTNLERKLIDGSKIELEGKVGPWRRI